MNFLTNLKIDYSKYSSSSLLSDKWDKGIGIGGRKVSNLRYADDTTLIAGNREDLIELIEKVKSSSEKAGLYINVKKTKVMATGELDSIIVDGENIEIVEIVVFLGALITSGGQIDIYYIWNYAEELQWEKVQWGFRGKCLKIEI